jgi:hypothetical protein
MSLAGFVPVWQRHLKDEELNYWRFYEIMLLNRNE